MTAEELPVDTFGEVGEDFRPVEDVALTLLCPVVDHEQLSAPEKEQVAVDANRPVSDALLLELDAL